MPYRVRSSSHFANLIGGTSDMTSQCYKIIRELQLLVVYLDSLAVSGFVCKITATLDTTQCS